MVTNLRPGGPMDRRPLDGSYVSRTCVVDNALVLEVDVCRAGLTERAIEAIAPCLRQP
jgi:hypothetical protein